MSYVTPTALSTGCLVTAAIWNQNVVSNVATIAASPMTIDFVNDRIGIGASLPVRKLDVSGSGAETTQFLAGRTIAVGNMVGGASAVIDQNLGAFAFINAAGVAVAGMTAHYAAAGDGANAYISFRAGNIPDQMRVTASGILMGGTASNTKNTDGLTINQSIASDEILSLKGSDVNHGMTTITETNTFARFLRAYSSSLGGLSVHGLSTSTLGIALRAEIATEHVSKSTVAEGALTLDGRTKSGTGITSMSGCANIVVISNVGQTQFIFRADGDFYANAAVTASAFDAFDDLKLVRALEIERAPESAVRGPFDAWLKYGRRDLEAADIAVFNDAPGQDGSVFVNYTALARLHSGALWQLHQRTATLEQRLADMALLLGPPKET